MLSLEFAKSSLYTGSLVYGHVDPEGERHLEFVIQELDGECEDILSNTGASIGQRLEDLLVHCTQRIGLIERKSDLRRAIRGLPAPDRVKMLVGCRIAAFGKQYLFRHKCECGHVNDILHDLELVTAPEVEEWSGNRLIGKIEYKGQEIEVGYHYVTSVDEAWIAGLIGSEEAKSKMATVTLMMRLDSINGQRVPRNESTELVLKKLPSPLRTKLRELLESDSSVDVDDKAEFACESCGKEHVLSIDMDSIDFFTQSALSQD